MYLKEDVDKLASAMEQFMEIYTLSAEESKPELVPAQSWEDIEATIKNRSTILWGPDTLT